MKQNLSTIFFALFLCACSEPFPNTADLSDSFNEKKEQVATLEAMLDESSYFVVGLRGATITGYWFEGEPYDGQVAEQEHPENADRWAELLREVKARSIERLDDGELWIPIGYKELSGEFHGTASYVSSQKIDNEFRQCEDKFWKARCGKCIVDLEDDWWLVYRWSPRGLTDEIFNDWQDGRITEENFDHAQSELIEECFLDGGTLLDDIAS